MHANSNYLREHYENKLNFVRKIKQFMNANIIIYDYDIIRILLFEQQHAEAK